MTNPRAAAMEAAVEECGPLAERNWQDNEGMPDWFGMSRLVCDAFLARMAEAGWVMVRDVGEAGEHDTYDERWYEDGWNDCRAAMLGSKGDE